MIQTYIYITSVLLRKDYESGILLSFLHSDRDRSTNFTFSSMPSKIIQFFYLLYAGLILVMRSIFNKFRITSNTPDLAMTVPLNVKRLSYFSPLKAKILRRTKERWCWFDKANKDDKEAGTRLGTLRYLPYEIREQIFKIALEDYFDDIFWRRKRCGTNQLPNSCYLPEFQLRSNFDLFVCCCKRDRMPEIRHIFDLASYYCFPRSIGRAPLNLRFTSPSIEPEFERIFLTCSTFEFECAVTVERFLDLLSPFQQSQLKCLRLVPFEDRSCYYVPRDCNYERRDHWMTVCQRLPLGLKSVEFVMPDCLIDIPGSWSTRPQFYEFDDTAKELELAAELLQELCKKVRRASPRAVISLTSEVGMNEDERNLVDAMLREIEPWSEEWLAWIDEMHGLE